MCIVHNLLEDPAYKYVNNMTEMFVKKESFSFVML